jgi:hypothetical protein
MEWRDERGELYVSPPHGTPIHDLATTDDNLKAVQILLKHGADISIKNQAGEPAGDIARREKAVECVAELYKYLQLKTRGGSLLLRRLKLGKSSLKVNAICLLPLSIGDILQQYSAGMPSHLGRHYSLTMYCWLLRCSYWPET